MAAPHPEPSPALSYRFLLIVCCGLGFASYVTCYMRFPVVPLYAHLGADTVMVGLINAAFLLSAGALSLPLGCGRPPGHEALAGGMLTLRPSFLLAVSSTPHQLIWIYLFSGAGLAAFGPTTMSYVAGISPPTHLGRSYGWYTTALYVGMSLGPAAGGFVAEAWGFSPVFIPVGLTYLRDLLAHVLFPAPGPATSCPDPSQPAMGAP